MTTLAGILGIPVRLGSESMDGFNRNARPPSSESAVIREGRGINFVEHGEHLPDYTEGAAGDKDLITRLT
jgi:hypothetical protein